MSTVAAVMTMRSSSMTWHVNHRSHSPPSSSSSHSGDEGMRTDTD